MSDKARIELIRSTIGTKPNQRKTVKALGLKKINSSVEHELTPSIVGMIKTVQHLLKVEVLKS